MSAVVGDEWGDMWSAEVPHGGIGTATTLEQDAPRLYQSTSIGFLTDEAAPVIEPTNGRSQ